MPCRVSLAERRAARVLLKSVSTEEPAPEFLRARQDFLLFRKVVCKRDSFTHHRRWSDILNTGIDSQCLIGCAGQNTDILAPRGSSKSTYLGEWTAWQIGRHSAPDVQIDIQILYLSFGVAAARSKSAVIKNIIATDEYQKVFPWVRPGKKWADEHWQIDLAWAGISAINSDFTLYCAGLAGSITSRRSHLVIIDDPVKSAESIANPTVREKVDSNWVNVIRPTMFEGARAVGLGTRYTPDDVHCTTFTKERDWLQVEESALLKTVDGEEVSYWPEQWSTEYLQKLRKDDPISFSFQYQNRIVRTSEVSIDPKWIHKGFPPTRFDAFAIGGDLSSSLKEKADYTVFVLAGRLGNDFWILDYRRGRWSGNREKIEKLIEIWEEWDCAPMDLAVESVAYQSSFKGDWLHYGVKEKNCNNLMYKEPQTRGDKLQRLKGITGLLANGLVKFNNWRDLSRIEWELVNFGAADHDDCADAVVYALQALVGKRPLEM